MLRQQGRYAVRACFVVSQCGYCVGRDIEEPIISSSRTNVTAQLWKSRVKKDLLDEAKKKSMEKMDAKDLPSFIISKSPSDSYVSIDLPFGSQPTIREQYRSWQEGRIRMGKVLEDLDALAGNIAHTHADDNNPQTRPLQIVTACVDRVDVIREFPMDIDVNMHGNVSYVGRSSMHISVEVAEKENPENVILTSSFLMVARDSSTGKSTPVNVLDIQTDEEKAKWILGEEAKAIRKKEGSSSLANTIPTPEEIKAVHKVHYPGKEGIQEENRKTVNMRDTTMNSVTVTQPQEKNTKENIFGGYLMRKAYELGMATALRFCGSKTRPFLLAVDEISFHRPVKVGSVITFEATVIFTTPRACQMKVETHIHDLLNDTQHKSNTFHFTFATNSDEPIPAVKPISYCDAMDFIDGQRRFQSSLRFAKQLGSTLEKHYT